MEPLILLHVFTASIALIAGYLAMIFRKGSSWHGAAGTVFFVTMLIMAATGAYISTFIRPIPLNVVAAFLTIYLVSTSWVASKRRDGKVNAFDWAALILALTVGTSSVGYGFARGGKAIAIVYFVFGMVALLSAFADVRMIRRGGYVGAKRIKRHLWRMCLAFLIAAMSFYPGQAKLFPKAWRDTNLLYLPLLLILGSMIFWLIRISLQSRRSAALKSATPTG